MVLLVVVWLDFSESTTASMAVTAAERSGMRPSVKIAATC